ncbi:serine/threonine-protein phosphatase 2A regulatory subunit B'' subunit beta isoform X1 [Myotis myotis]|uniref:serine/threonine-protein phosphatase 2A regulatory subunit B'' subunit beta isoform X1 n=1 Tax=Myotis myotis TaxID=51298 RepID=UPI00174DDAD2|nr:serine/threonine-protein phosphatase 2A regulatory subunit B'' subunit beta isoform X1 [Myotis myotis]
MRAAPARPPQRPPGPGRAWSALSPAALPVPPGAAAAPTPRAPPAPPSPRPASPAPGPGGPCAPTCGCGSCPCARTPTCGRSSPRWPAAATSCCPRASRRGSRPSSRFRRRRRSPGRRPPARASPPSTSPGAARRARRTATPSSPGSSGPSPSSRTSGPPWRTWAKWPRPAAARCTGRGRSSVPPAESAQAPSPSTSSWPCGESRPLPRILQNCHDEATRFVHLLMSPGCNYLVQEDFVPFLQDVVNTHPGLAFLKAASEFHSRYITTVIQRIFYAVNRSWSGRITSAELRRSSFLQNVALLEEEADINQLTEFFSYEHFYVIYCKFWELDTDHDLLIGQQDLARHNDHAISTKMIERIFSGAVTRGRKVQKEGKISYADFVWFLISEEDKRTPTSIEYWFRCMDLDGDGALSMFELEHFYEEQSRRLDSMGIEALPFEDCLCQMLDLVQPQSPGKITLRDLKRCRLAHIFFDTFFNIEKYLDHEQREQVSLLRETEAEGPELSDWERYAAEEYDLLVAEEAAGEPWEDGYEAELSPVDQKLGGLRTALAQRPFLEAPALGAVHLFDCEADEELQPS